MKKYLLSVVAAIAVSSVSIAQIQGYSVGQTVSNFTVVDTDGQTHTLYDYTSQGKWVILDFFFDTCPPCQSTSQYFSELHEKYGCNSGDIICIAMNNGSDTDAEVIAFENAYGGSSAHAPAVSSEGGSGSVDNAFDPAAYPTYCLIGADNTLKLDDIWPINSVSDFENAFSGISFNPTVMSCAPVGINDSELSSDISIYPNPASENVNIEFNSTVSGNVTVEVYNIVGERLYTNNLSAVTGTNMINLPVEAYDNGQYIVQFTQTDGATYRNIFQVIK